jgi:feruloyl esterase
MATQAAALGVALAGLGLATVPAARAQPLAATPDIACAGLAQLALMPATSISRAQYVPPDSARPAGASAGPFLPGHCLLQGRIAPRVGVDGRSYSIGFELRLPDTWNGRLVYMGGGGNDGVIREAIGPIVGPRDARRPALAEGFAVVSTDAGHTGADGSFALDPLARIDHAYNAHDKTAVAARSYLRQRYGRAVERAYFVGCSGGGRQGMMFSQRFPDYFDGIVAIAPAMRVSSGATIAAAWDVIAFDAIAPAGPDGKRVLSRAFSQADLTLVSQAILKACDADDGAVDGLVARPQACRFDPAVLQCAGAKTDACLSAPQVGALRKAFAGPRDTSGRALYAGQPWDPGIDAPGWRQWKLGNAPGAKPDARHIVLMQDALAHEFLTPPEPGFDILRFDFDRDPARMQAFSWVYDTADDATLAPYRKRGGKLMLVHGMADGIFSATDTVDYYQRLAANNGGPASVRDFARLFLVPGMNHCAGGRATDQFDVLTPMVEWVERGTAPDAIPASAASNNAWMPNRTRPLCAYPAYPRYRGTGSLEDAANFACTSD